jgi:hypothetical protein
MSGTDARRTSTSAADFANDSVSVQGTDHVDNVSVTTDGSSVDVTGLRTTTHITGSEAADFLTVDTHGDLSQVAVSDGVEALISLIVG